MTLFTIGALTGGLVSGICYTLFDLWRHKRWAANHEKQQNLTRELYNHQQRELARRRG